MIFNLYASNAALTSYDSAPKALQRQDEVLKSRSSNASPKATSVLFRDVDDMHFSPFSLELVLTIELSRGHPKPGWIVVHRGIRLRDPRYGELQSAAFRNCRGCSHCRSIVLAGGLQPRPQSKPKIKALLSAGTARSSAIADNPEKVFLPHLAAFQHELEAIETCIRICMRSAQGRARSEYSSKSESGEAQLLHRMGGGIPSAKNNPAHPGLLDEVEQQMTKRSSELHFVGT